MAMPNDQYVRKLKYVKQLALVCLVSYGLRTIMKNMYIYILIIIILFFILYFKDYTMLLEVRFYYYYYYFLMLFNLLKDVKILCMDFSLCLKIGLDDHVETWNTVQMKLRNISDFRCTISAFFLN